MTDIARELLTTALEALRTSPDVASNMLSAEDMIEELEAAGNEFGGLEVEATDSGSRVAVTTEPITLHEVELGRFRIWLKLPSLSFRIEALDPNPSATNTSIVHPHVSDEVMCTGESQDLVVGSLRGGRFSDFFLIVKSILSTYNRNSPHASIERWGEGGQCQGCDASMDEDEADICGDCGSMYCNSCACFCGSCDTVYCSNCRSTYACEHSGNDYCDNCMHQCDGCCSWFQLEHGRLGSCSSCKGDEICQDCGIACDVCEELVCSPCITGIQYQNDISRSVCYACEKELKRQEARRMARRWEEKEDFESIKSLESLKEAS